MSEQPPPDLDRDDSTTTRRRSLPILRLCVGIGILAWLVTYGRIVDCPDCVRDDPYHSLATEAGIRRWKKLMIHELGDVKCERCGWERRITVVNRLLDKDYDCCRGKVFGIQSAKQNFEEIDEKIQRANSIRLKVTIESSVSTAPDQKDKVAATLLLQGGWVSAAEDGPSGFELARDYGRLQGRRGDVKRVLEMPDALYYGLVHSLPWLGVDYGFNVLRVGVFEESPRVFVLDIHRQWELTDFRFVDPPGAHKMLTHRLQKRNSAEPPIQVTLEYDLGPIRLIRRTSTQPTEGGGVKTVVETYDEFTLNETIPDESFRLPPAKK